MFPITNLLLPNFVDRRTIPCQLYLVHSIERVFTGEGKANFIALNALDTLSLYI